MISRQGFFFKISSLLHSPFVHLNILFSRTILRPLIFFSSPSFLNLISHQFYAVHLKKKSITVWSMTPQWNSILHFSSVIICPFLEYSIGSKHTCPIFCKTLSSQFHTSHAEGSKVHHFLFNFKLSLKDISLCHVVNLHTHLWQYQDLSLWQFPQLVNIICYLDNSLFTILKVVHKCKLIELKEETENYVKMKICGLNWNC